MNKHFQYGFSFAFFRFTSAFNNSTTHLRKLIRSRTDECMAETGEFSLIVRCHAPLVTSKTGIIPRGDLICTRVNSAITVFSASVFPNRRSRNGGDIYCASASQMFHVSVEKHGTNSHLMQKGKIAELALGYGGAVGALKAMGALDMGLSEDELQPLVNMWRNSNQNIVSFWWQIDNAVKTAIQLHTTEKVGCLEFSVKNGMLFIILPSGRKLAYVQPRIGMNQFGGESVTYMGIDATKKWSRIESYGPKFVENIVQAVSRDILAYAMQTLKHCFIVGHDHDELIIECSEKISLNAVCEQMGRTPKWITGLPLRADGYECGFYMKS